VSLREEKRWMANLGTLLLLSAAFPVEITSKKTSSVDTSNPSAAQWLGDEICQT